jgi:hypothetical protein
MHEHRVVDTKLIYISAWCGSPIVVDPKHAPDLDVVEIMARDCHSTFFRSGAEAGDDG